MIRAMSLRALPLVSSLLIAPAVPAAQTNVDWDQVQQIKNQLLEQAAANAMEQQKRGKAAPVAIGLPSEFQTDGNLQAQRNDDGALVIEVEASPRHHRDPAAEALRFELPEPIDMLENHSGLAMIIRTRQGTSPEVRWGVRLIGADGKVAEIRPAVPVLSHWDQNPHEIYFDWAFINYGNVDDAIAVLRSVVALEFTAASALHSPQRGSSREARRAKFEMSDLRLVDYLQGSYDPNRHNWGWDGSERKDLTLQHRTQEVSGIVARFGGDEGIKSVIESLDLCVLTQCWDGSFLDGRRGANTVVSGEYTHGFTLHGILDGYRILEEKGVGELDEQIPVGPETMTRREAYQRMFYRGAMSRAAHLPGDYRDDIIGGDTLMTGANRVLGYAIAMHLVADVLHDQAKAQEVRDRFEPIMQQIADAQGRYSGGFPLLAEGNRFEGRGIHYDAGYIRTHMDWLVIGVRRTGHPLLVQMLDRYQQVIEAAMDQRGEGIIRLLSERGGQGSPPWAGAVRLILPDATAQLGLEHGMPILAQWGYNVGMPQWSRWEPGARINHFTSAANARGYSLGAHMSILVDDLTRDPKPRDIGYRFPRQFPIWSSRFYDKEDGRHTRTSRVYIHADGSMINDFDIKPGEYLETVGVPVLIESPGGTVIAEALELKGWPALLADDAEVHMTGRDIDLRGRIDQSIELTLQRETELTITAPEVTLPAEMGGRTVPFSAKLKLTPEQPGSPVRLRVINEAAPYEHKIVPPQVLRGLPAGTNVALSEHGARVTNVRPRAAVDMGRVIDSKTDNFGALDSLASASFRIELAQPFELDRIVIYQGQYGPPEERRFALPKELTVRISGREPMEVTLENKPHEPQEFDLGGVEAEQIDIEVRGVYPAASERVTWGGFAAVEILKK